MEEKFNKLFEKEAEYINVSAKAQAVHTRRIETEKELANLTRNEAVK